MESSFLEQYRACRQRAALTEGADRGRIAAVGRDRLAYLHAMLTNDIASLQPGTGRYAAYLTPQGRIIADMIVLELGDLTLLDVDASRRPVVLEKLEQFIFSEDVRLSDLTSELAGVRVSGPQAADALARVCGGVSAADLHALAEYESRRGSFEGGSVVMAADCDLGVPGFNVYLNADRARTFESALGQGGVANAGREVAETLRIEAGRPRFGADIDEATIPLEAGIEHRAISFTKGCYPGQEVITRVLHRGHGRVAKKLVGLRCDGAVVPGYGDTVVADEKDVGRVTSAAPSPTLDCPIALGYVQRDFVTAGTRLSIVHGEARVAAAVAPLPFVPFPS